MALGENSKVDEACENQQVVAVVKWIDDVLG